MARLNTSRTLATQTLISDEIKWRTETVTRPLAPSRGPATHVRGMSNVTLVPPVNSGSGTTRKDR